MAYLILVFIFIALTIYSALNYYLYKKIIKISPIKKIWLFIPYLLLYMSPIIATILNKNEISSGSFILSYVGFNWLAFVFLFLVYHGVYDLICKWLPIPTGRKPTLSILMLCFIILVYGSFDVQSIKIENITLKTKKLPPSVKDFKILQFSDIHFGPTLGAEMAKKLLKISRKTRPDLIVFTGDLMDKNIFERMSVISIMKMMDAPYGKYACLGNHEYISGINDARKFIEQMNIVLLEDEMVSLKDVINLAGANDLSGPRFQVPLKAENTYLQNKSNERYTILLKHRPRIDTKSTPYFDLQLSGHTHQGQIFPFYFIVKIAFPYISGLYQINDNTQLYVNRGTGFWGPANRFLTPPEATLIHLHHQ